MKSFLIKNFFFLIFLIFFVNSLQAQEKIYFSKMTREDVLNISYEDLMDMELSILIKLSQIVGVSLDELYEMILNKNIVIASKEKEESFDSPLSTEIISADEIRQSGATSIVELLRLVSGTIVREKTSGNYDFHIRGGDNVPPNNMMLYSENITTLVMIDNRKVYSYAFGGTFWESLAIEIIDIERIELIKGSSGALYGSNAVSGVINIITKKIKNKKLNVNANLQAGNFNSKIAEFSISKGLNEKLNFRISGNYKYFERTQEEIYFWSHDEYLDYSFIDSLNPKNPTNNVKNNGKDAYFDDINLGMDKKGINFFANYSISNSINFDFSAGSQSSKVLSSVLDDSYISVSQREIETNYINLTSKIKNFSSQVAFTNGYLNYYKGSNEFQYDYGITQINLGYSFKIFELLNLKFDFDYQNAWYDDMPYLSKVTDTTFFTNGLFNGKKHLTNFGFSFRTDYSINKKLRLIFASRVESFNYPKDLYFSNQFVSSYKINDKNLIRFVFSNSNRGPFMTDMYLNYDWNKNPYQMIHFDGNKDLKLTKTNILEIGYRSKLRKNLFVDFEFFYTQSKNYASLMPDSVHIQVIPTETTPIFNPNYITASYKNLDLKLKQIGISTSFNAIINEKLRFKLFGTFQKTFLNNYSPFVIDSLIVQMIRDIIYNEISITNQQTSSGKYSNFTEDYEHKSTPNIFGGLNIYFLPNENWECFLNSYFYTDQTFNHKHGIFDIKEKFIVNSKISYCIYKKNWIYFNIRNLFDNQRFEFAFLDKTRTKFLIGMKIDF